MDPEEVIMLPKIKKCGECGGSLREQTIVHTQPWGEQLYRFENVPAFVCQQCGNVWLAAEVSQLMDEVIQTHRKPKKYQRVPVFSLTELSKA